MFKLVQKMRGPRRNIRCGGFSLVECIIASIIVAVAIGAMFSSWATTFNSSNITTQVTAAEEIDRQVLEIAKVYGPTNLPTGTYNSSTQTGSWSGAYVSSTWTSGSTAYYSINGTQVASSTAAGAYFSVTVTITDSPVLQGTGSTYTIENSTLRSIVVTTTCLQSPFVLSMATNLIEGGM